MTVFVGNTNLLTLVGLKSNITDSAINDATVTVTITDKSGAAIAGSWPLAMTYVADSDGDYRAVVADDLPLIAHRTYIALVEADAGDGRKGQWQFKFTPEVRR